jgi:4-amino-4-deoxy-L-arabinose transferase-like glycosyltransferase
VTATRDISPSSIQSRATATVAAITAVAAALRLYDIGGPSLWMDEASTAHYATVGWGAFVTLVSEAQGNMSLYYLLLRPWAALGDSEAMLRLPSAAFSIATVPLIYLLGKRLFGTKAGIWAAALLAVHANAVSYAQEARGYSLLIFLVVASWLFLLRLLERPAAFNCAGYVVTTVLTPYAHFFGVFTVGAQWVGLMAWPRRGELPWRRLLVCAAAIGLGLMPAAVYMLARSRGQLAWVAPTSASKVVHALAFVFGTIGGRSGGIAGPLTMAVVLLALGVSAREFARCWRTRAEPFRAYALAWSGLLLPFAVPVAISIFKPILEQRYLLVCLPFVIVLAASGVDRAKSGSWRGLLGFALIATALYWDGYHFVKERREDWRGVTQYVVANAQAGDAIVIYSPYQAPVVAYYRRRFDEQGRFPVQIYPLMHVPESQVRFKPRPAAQGFDRQLVDTIAGLGGEHARLWLVTDSAKPNSRKESFLARVRSAALLKYRKHDERSFERVQVSLYSEPVTRP